MNCAPRAEAGPASPHTATVVLVGFLKPEQDFLRGLLEFADCSASDCRWAIQANDTVDAAVTAVGLERISVAVCDHDRISEGWKELLGRTADLSQPPCVIVTSRLADEYLWAEALNLGAYDVLARPFDPADVVRSVNLARVHWQGRCSARHRAAHAMA